MDLFKCEYKWSRGKQSVNFKSYKFLKLEEVMDVDIKNTGTKGLGVYASRSFKKGELVGLVSGTIQSKQTAYTIQIGWDQHLLPNEPFVYINHSCDPNLGVRSDENGIPAFVAFRDIAEGEELHFDYAMTEYKPINEFDMTCHCGSKLCRGKLGYYSELTEELKEKYRDYTAAYLSTSKVK